MYFFEFVFLFSSDICPRVELLDHMVVLFLVFYRKQYGNSILFSIVAASIYIPTTVYKGSPFSIYSPTLVICGLFDDSHSDECEVISRCGFDLHFSTNEHLFICLLAICISSLEKNVYSGLLPIFKSGCLFFDIELYELFI